MIGSHEKRPPAALAPDAGSAAADGLSDQECVERLQAAIADHAGAQPADIAAAAGRQDDDSGESGELGEVAALIGRLAVPLEY